MSSLISCKFDVNCFRKDCKFNHPNGRKIDARISTSHTIHHCILTDTPIVSSDECTSEHIPIDVHVAHSDECSSVIHVLSDDIDNVLPHDFGVSISVDHGTSPCRFGSKCRFMNTTCKFTHPHPDDDVYNEVDDDGIPRVFSEDQKCMADFDDELDIDKLATYDNAFDGVPYTAEDYAKEHGYTSVDEVYAHLILSV